MALELSGRRLAKVGIVGSGQIGPDVALHFVETLSRYGVEIAVVDISADALEKGRAKVAKKLKKRVEAGRLAEDRAATLRAGIQFSLDYQQLAQADWVVEAATEELSIKRKIFAQLEQVCRPDALLTSNSSHLEPEQIFAQTQHPGRCAITHYFFPAERNPLVEVVVGDRTASEISPFLLHVYELIGKLPVAVGSRYGYAIDPVFEGLFLAAALAVERGMATVEQVDLACQRALGQGVGPFTAMNLTGGNPLTNIGLRNYHDTIMPWFHAPPLLEKQLEAAAPWPMAQKGQPVEVDEQTERAVADWMLGAYFMLAGEIFDAGLIQLNDFEQAMQLGLAMRPAFTLMNQHGLGKSLELVERFVDQNAGATVPRCIRRQAERDQPWQPCWISREDRGGVAVLTINRFKVLNALNRRVLRDLSQMIDDVAGDADVQAVVIRGFGTRAFVSGADIRELAALERPEDAVEIARFGQGILSKIERLSKPVIAAMNGLAFGGGNELAMACHARLAAQGQKVFVGQPEPKLGVLPGYGGTQRLPRWVGMAVAWPMLRTGNPISSAEALQIGLVREELPPAMLLDAAITLARDAAAGKVELPGIPTGPIDVPESLPEVELAGLSRKIDQVLCEVTLEGAKAGLDAGLELEAQGFGRCLQTEDFRIGMANFIKNGPKIPAKFVNR